MFIDFLTGTLCCKFVQKFLVLKMKTTRFVNQKLQYYKTFKVLYLVQKSTKSFDIYMMCKLYLFQ